MLENKKYKCIKDLQGTGWYVDKINTIEEWRELAVCWCESDGNDELSEYMHTIPQNEVLDFISETWQIIFEEVK